MIVKSRTLLNLLAKNIRKERQRRSLSQEELADLAGVHRTYVGMIERSEKNITVLGLEKIAKALQVDIVDLFQRDKDDR